MYILNVIICIYLQCRFAGKIEDTFTLMMLGLVFYFGIVFCLYGFLLLTVSSKKDVLLLDIKIFRYTSYI